MALSTVSRVIVAPQEGHNGRAQTVTLARGLLDLDEPPQYTTLPRPARWQSGYAGACKAPYVGSIPARASKPTHGRSTREPAWACKDRCGGCRLSSDPHLSGPPPDTPRRPACPLASGWRRWAWRSRPGKKQRGFSDIAAPILLPITIFGKFPIEIPLLGLNVLLSQALAGVLPVPGSGTRARSGIGPSGQLLVSSALRNRAPGV